MTNILASRTGGLSLARRATPRNRAGFTLIELMVVMVVISLIAALLTMGGLGVVARARQTRTIATISKVDEAIQERVASINRWHERPFRQMEKEWNQRTPKWIGVWQSYFPAPGDPGHRDLTLRDSETQALLTALSRKQMLRDRFPMTQLELFACSWFPNTADNRATLAQLDQPGEIFLYALLNAPVLGGLPMVLEDFDDGEIADTDGDGHFELIDAWEQPLRFYRWPTRLVRGGKGYNDSWDSIPSRSALMPSAPAGPAGTTFDKDPLKSDPDDPIPRIVNDVKARFHDYYTWHAPLVVSAGPDMNLGIDEPTEVVQITTTSGPIPVAGLAQPLSVRHSDPSLDDQLFDNITNHNIDGGQ